MPERLSLSGTWTLYLLFLSASFAAAAGAAALPSSTSASSTSASANTRSANQRSARSAAALLNPRSRFSEEGEEGEERGGRRGGGGGEDKGRRSDDCSSPDFVENFFRLLSGPVGKEAEALVAAVVKLLSEDDRVHWLATAAGDQDQEEEGEEGEQEQQQEEEGEEAAAMGPSARVRGSFGRPPAFKPGPAAGRGDQPTRVLFGPFGLSLPSLYKRGVGQDGDRRGGRRPTSGKRLAPKFNPTGWRRRKRSAGEGASSRESLKRFLRGVLARYASARPQYAPAPVPIPAPVPAVPAPVPASIPSLPELAYYDVRRGTGPEVKGWRDSKRSWRRVYRRRPQQLKPKRKPLEFNPTGW